MKQELIGYIFVFGSAFVIACIFPILWLVYIGVFGVMLLKK